MKANVEKFNQLVTEWSKFQGFIDKIQQQAGQFSASVVEKLQLEYVIKQQSVTQEITDFLGVQGDVLTQTKEALATLKHNNAAYDEVEQELILRHAIGALSDDDFNHQLSELKASMSDYATQVDFYNAEIQGIEEMFDTWSALSGAAEPVTNSAAPQSQQSKSVEAPVNEKKDTADSLVDSSVPTPTVPETPMVSVVGDDLGDLPQIAELEDALEPIEALGDDVLGDLDADLEFNDGPSPFASVPGDELNFELSNDSLGFDEGLDLSAELIDPDDFSGSIDLGGMSMGLDADLPSAMLIRDHGVHGSEVVYPFKGTNYKIGRAPNNDIQIKDDSKVSRNHCELLRRGNQFYLVDLKSANGTLVNGEAFEGEYKLYGGEELKVGETLFRFTIQ